MISKAQNSTLHQTKDIAYISSSGAAADHQTCAKKITCIVHGQKDYHIINADGTARLAN
jgi:20S proteasome alpha/beta subunit